MLPFGGKIINPPPPASLGFFYQSQRNTNSNFHGKIKYFCLRTLFKLWNDCCQWQKVPLHTHTPNPPLHTHTRITLFWFWMDRWQWRVEGGGGVEVLGLKYIISWKEWGPVGFSQSGPSLHWGWVGEGGGASAGVCVCSSVGGGGASTTLPLHTVTWARRGPICQIISCCPAQRFYLQEFHRGRIE